MSFNYLEVASVLNELKKEISDPTTKDGFKLQDVAAIDFPLPANILADVNIGLFFEHKVLVFSLQQPWIGVYFLPFRFFRRSGKKSAPIERLKQALIGVKLKNADVPSGERIVRLSFENSKLFEVQLFPARPNWILYDKQVLSWKPTKDVPKPRLKAEIEDAPASSELRSLELYEIYLKKRQKEALESLLRQAENQVRSNQVRWNKIERELKVSLQKSQKAHTIKESAETLKSILHKYPKNHRASKIEQVSITLDPNLTLSENAEKFFERYKKLKRTTKEVELRLQVVSEQVSKSKNALNAISQFKAQKQDSFDSALKALKELFSSLGIQIRILNEDTKQTSKNKQLKAKNKWAAQGLKSFSLKDGCVAWIGKNHNENKILVQNLARGNDVWMHLKGKPGAHGIIQVPKNKTASLESLLVGAILVAHYSGVGINQKAEVDYTFRKYVKKISSKGPKNTGQFLVTYSQNKTLMVTVDEKTLSKAFLGEK